MRKNQECFDFCLADYLLTFEYPRVNAIADASCIDEPVRALYNCIVRKYVLSLSKVAVQFDAKESEMNVIVNIRVLQNQTLQ